MQICCSWFSLLYDYKMYATIGFSHKENVLLAMQNSIMYWYLFKGIKSFNTWLNFVQTWEFPMFDFNSYLYKNVMIILFVELCLADIFRLMVTLVLISIHGINTSVILIHSVSVVKFTLVRFYHINEIRQSFFFHNWDGFKVSHHALKKKVILSFILLYR